MTAEDLAVWCKSPDAATATQFPKIVAAALDVPGIQQRDLARDFEVAESTVSRWAEGTTRPHPRIQRLVVSWIAKRAARLARSRS